MSGLMRLFYEAWSTVPQLEVEPVFANALNVDAKSFIKSSEASDDLGQIQTTASPPAGDGIFLNEFNAISFSHHCLILSKVKNQRERVFYVRLCAAERLSLSQLKAGPFKAAYLGQLNMYLQLLDDFVRKPHENPSIGIILCSDAEKPYVEYAVRDYAKPMGVAVYKTRDEMPEKLRRALPSIEDLRKLL